MNWVQALHTQPAFGLLDHAWSLSIEEQFYVVWPLILILAHRAGGVKAVGLVALVAALASAVLRAVLAHHGVPDRRLYFGLDTHADGLLLGCGLAALTLLRPALHRGHDPPIDAVGGTWRPWWRWARPRPP